jgi:putative transposase
VALTAELFEAGIAGSIGTVGDARDTALCESTIGLFKTEAINLTGPSRRDRRDVEWQVAHWVHWYNTSRLHSSIGHPPPIEFEHHHRQATTVPRRFSRRREVLALEVDGGDEGPVVGRGGVAAGVRVVLD